MSASVEAGYKGIVSVQDSVTSTTEISIYLRPCRPTCLVRGGDPSAAERFMKDPENLEKFEAWVNSRTEGATDALINIRVEHYGTLLQRCPDQSRPHGQQLSAAWKSLDREMLDEWLQMSVSRWSPATGAFYPIDARCWFSVSGASVSIEPVVRHFCTLHERTETRFMANYEPLSGMRVAVESMNRSKINRQMNQNPFRCS
ncbi:hypothetical protein BDV23DRAFT_150585 [Aspergillus alliaceus]|uniref:Uncharacterized protein n=1 Tax=Petromyces alliaceus TaxID=209559 RepID=A0A5N7CG50_PETAA|nr:hypothetical protein BDV23DRAFT_150585 [Aspergillus alliaceus]